MTTTVTAIKANITEAVGRTPLIRLNRVAEDVSGVVAVKMESMNPLGSVKDRIGVAMINDAESASLIKAGKTTLVEPTSGNTGIALAFVAAARGYDLILTMPETMSLERRKLLSALGAKIELTEGAKGMRGAIAKAEEILKEKPDSHMLQQFNNKANPKVHFETTGPEIWADTDGKIDILVVGVGTGGTLTGAGGFLKSKNPALKIVAVEPIDSPIISQSLKGEELKPGPHKIQGIGAGFIPGNLDTKLIDEVITVTNDQAFEYARLMHHKEGIFCGISSGANLYAALQVAKRPENKGKTIVTFVCSTGERYLSTALFD